MYRRLLYIVSVGSLLLALMIMGRAILWYSSGGRAYSVQTSSMIPTFRPGDAVLMRRAPVATLRSGQIISYRLPSGAIVSHRLIARTAAGLLVTKGDHNPTADTPIGPSQVVGRVIIVAPHLGYWTNRLRSPLGMTTVLYLPAVMLIVLEVRRAVRRLGQACYRVPGHVSW